MSRLEEDSCDTCVEFKTKLKDPNLDSDEREAYQNALENHGQLARTQRGTMKAAIVMWARKTLDGQQQLAGMMDALDLMPANVDEDPKPRPPVTECKVLLMAEDYAGNITLPTYGLKRPGKDYYASNLLIYAFVQCDMSSGVNHVVTYDERGMGKDADALCTLRIQLHLRKQVIMRQLPVSSRPTILFQVMDNNVGQNKSEIVFKFFALLSLTFFPDGVTLLYLLPGHSHMACDRVVGWLRKAIGKTDHYLPQQLVAAMNNVANVEAEFLDHSDPLSSMMTCNWSTVLDNHLRSIGPLPKIGGFTKQYFFEFKQGLLTKQKEATSEIVAVHDYLGTDHGGPGQPTRAACCSACVRALEAVLFKGDATFSGRASRGIRHGWGAVQRLFTGTTLHRPHREKDRVILDKGPVHSSTVSRALPATWGCGGWRNRKTAQAQGGHVRRTAKAGCGPRTNVGGQLLRQAGTADGRSWCPSRSTEARKGRRACVGLAGGPPNGVEPVEAEGIG